MRSLHILLVAVAVLLGQTNVSVRSEATVMESVIRLRDIAVVNGPLKSRIDTIEVGRVPAPGTARFILRDELFLYSKLPADIRTAVTLAGEPRCRVAMASQDLTLGQIEAALRDSIQNHLNWTSEQCRIIFKAPAEQVLAKIARNSYSIEPIELRSKTVKGNTLVPVTVVQGDLKTRFTVQALIEVQADVFVANRRIELGETVSLVDFTRKSMDITALPSIPITSLTGSDRYRVKSGIIPVGSVLMVNRVEEKAMIETGQMVSIRATVGK